MNFFSLISFFILSRLRMTLKNTVSNFRKMKMENFRNHFSNFPKKMKMENVRIHFSIFSKNGNLSLFQKFAIKFAGPGSAWTKMAAMENLVSELAVCELIENENKTFEEVSEILQSIFPNERGFSIKSVKRFCKGHTISRRQQIEDDDLDEIVQSAINYASTWVANSNSVYIDLIVNFCLPQLWTELLLSLNFGYWRLGQCLGARWWKAT